MHIFIINLIKKNCVFKYVLYLVENKIIIIIIFEDNMKI